MNGRASHRMRTFTLLLAAALLAPRGAAQTGDVVVKKDGARIRGLELTALELSCVRGTRGGETVEIPAREVREVEWGNAPAAFLAARAAMQRGDYRAATQLFGAVQSDRALVATDARFFVVAAAVAAAGDDQTAAATAAEHARAWLAAHGEHWRAPEALLLAGRAERLAGAFEAAAATLGALDDRATRGDFGAVWSVRARSELAVTWLGAGKAAPARAAFQSAASAAAAALGKPSADDAELRALATAARVGEGESFLGEKDFAAAAAFFEQLANGNRPELIAAGHAGVAEAVFLQAVANNRTTDVRKAQRGFALASVLDGDGGDASAKANYYLGRCLQALGREREGDAWKTRANAYFELVANDYATSRWAAAARTELAK